MHSPARCTRDRWYDVFAKMAAARDDANVFTTIDGIASRLSDGDMVSSFRGSST